MANTAAKGRVRSRNDVDFCSLSRADLARAFGVSAQATNKWDCPRNDDGSFSLPDVIAWKVGKASEGPGDKALLEIKKLEKDIEYKDTQIEKIAERTVPREEMERVLIERGAVWRQLWDQSVLKYANDFVMQPREVVLKMFHRFGKAVSEAFVGE